MKRYFLAFAALTCISSFAYANQQSDCISVARSLPKLKTPKTTIVQFGEDNWSTDNGGVSKLIEAINENPSLCPDLQKVFKFATLPEVKALAARTEKQGGRSAIEVPIFRGVYYGPVEDYGTYNSRTVYENANYKDGSVISLGGLELYNDGANSTAPYGCSLAAGQDECLKRLRLGVEQIERAEQH